MQKREINNVLQWQVIQLILYSRSSSSIGDPVLLAIIENIICNFRLLYKAAELCRESVKLLNDEDSNMSAKQHG